ncbi:MAG: insulinase family protein, partial [Oscillospiraceae bacterium]
AEVSTPLFQVGFRADSVPFGSERLRAQLMGELACEAVFGTSSPLYAALYADGLLSQDYGYGYEGCTGCALLCVGGESRDPKAVQDAILAEAARVAQEGIEEGLWLRLKKAAFGSRTRGLNSFENICVELAQAHFAGAEYLRFPEIFEHITKTDIEDCVRRWMTPARVALSVVMPLAGGTQ